MARAKQNMLVIGSSMLRYDSSEFWSDYILLQVMDAPTITRRGCGLIPYRVQISWVVHQAC